MRIRVWWIRQTTSALDPLLGDALREREQDLKPPLESLPLRKVRF